MSINTVSPSLLESLEDSIKVLEARKVSLLDAVDSLLTDAKSLKRILKTNDIYTSKSLEETMSIIRLLTDECDLIEQASENIKETEFDLFDIQELTHLCLKKVNLLHLHDQAC